MGVKSTYYTTREKAIERIVKLENDLRDKLRSQQLEHHSDKFLEDHLEMLNDQAHDGEGFENYIIEG